MLLMRIRGAWAGLATTAVLGALSWMLTFGSTFALAASPAIEAESFFDIGSGSATLNAIVNAQRVLTNYVFEYGKSGEACFASSSCTRTSSASVGATGEGVGVSIQLGALESSTTYEFRAIASNASGDTTVGTLETFKTLPVGLLGLPDSRGYEMVTPPDNEDADVYIPEGAINYMTEGPDGISTNGLFRA